jgi:hypothetical protein
MDPLPTTNALLAVLQNVSSTVEQKIEAVKQTVRNDLWINLLKILKEIEDESHPI